MFNETVKDKHLQIYTKYIQDNQFEENYPLMDHEKHLYHKPDCYAKWASILMSFDSIKKDKMNIIDLGSGQGPVPHIISSQGHSVIGVDNMRVNHPFKSSLVQMVLGDAIEFLTNVDENSVDVYIDSCSVTHFNPKSNSQYSNIGWKSVFDAVYKTLKPGGYFLCSSDVKLESNSIKGEFIIPEDIVNMSEQSGLSLTFEFNFDRIDSIYRQDSYGGGLGVANFIFIKNG